TVLGVIGDRVVHVGDTAFEHQVNDQLQLVQALEVGHFRRITGFNEGIETRLDQLNATAAQHSLLTEQVGFSLVLEGGFDDAGAAAAHARGVGQGNVLGVAGSVLIDGDQIRNTAALELIGSYSVARRLGHDHDHVRGRTRHYLVVVDRETVGEGQDGAFLQIRLQLILVQRALEFVRGQNHYQVSSGDCSGHI